MATRSGKRIHGSMAPIEDTVNEKTVAGFQSERKTRKKKPKENIDLNLKKRSNYVSYPADRDTPSLTAATHEEPTRRTRQNTLKENNVDISMSNRADSDLSNNNHVKKPRKVQKRVKPEHSTAKDSFVITKEEHAKPIEDNKKKSKKKKTNKRSTETADDKEEVVDDESLTENVRSKKKVGRKKKKSNSNICNRPVEDQIITSKINNEVNVSLDSFRSAAGSPGSGGATEGNRKISVNSAEVEQDSIKYATFDKTDNLRILVNGKNIDINDMLSENAIDNKCHYNENLNITFNQPGNASADLNTEDANDSKQKNKSSMKNNTFDKTDKTFEIHEVEVANATFDRQDANPRNSTFDKGSAKKRKLSQIISTSNGSVNNLNGTFEINLKGSILEPKSLDITFDKDSNKDLNTTFDMDNKSLGISENDSKKSSLISSDATVDITDDKSEHSSGISITSDDCKTENIMNLSPVLIESSIDDTRISAGSNMTPEKADIHIPSTPLRREGTFTKNGPDMSPEFNEKSPIKNNYTASPGCTPFPMSKSSQKEKIVLNVTRSIEKSPRMSSLVDTRPRQTKVMFCSPVNNPAVLSHMKGKVVKSNLKGSNKSFIFDNSAAPGRKRSHTHDEGESRAKRTRLALAREPQPEGRRPARPRTLSAAAKLADSGTPSPKTTTPSKPKPDGKVARTKLPNFAALHRKQFAKMESLDECQQRKARRARQLLTPTGSAALVERISPKGTPPTSMPAAAPAPRDPATKPHTPAKPKLSALEPPRAPYTRFGFKLNVDVNPFSVAADSAEIESKEKRAAGPARSATCLALPSLAGATGRRRDEARLAVMREKSFTEKRRVHRSESRTAIKGVRTNRRFELQMKWRNINA